MKREEEFVSADDKIIIIFVNSMNEIEIIGPLVIDRTFTRCVKAKIESLAVKTQMLLLKGSLDPSRISYAFYGNCVNIARGSL